MVTVHETPLERLDVGVVEAPSIVETPIVSVEAIDATIEKILEEAEERVGQEIKTDSEALPVMKHKRGGDYPVKQWS